MGLKKWLRRISMSAGRTARRPAEHDVFTRGFEEIIKDLIGTTGCIAAASVDGLCIRAGAFQGNAVKIGEVGINDRYVCCSA
jgi:hypothetical protein